MVNLLRSSFWVLLHFLKGILSVLDGKGIYKMSEPCCAPVAALFIGVTHLCAVVIAIAVIYRKTSTGAANTGTL